MLSSNKILISAKFLVALLENKTTEEKKKEILTNLDAGADVNEKFMNHSNNTPLHIAVKSEDVEIVNFLLQHGANVNNINDINETALDIAKELNTQAGHAIVKLLEDKIIMKGEFVGNEVESACSTQNDSKYVYQKRTGTSGIEGQLYETKLLSLILIRALVNKKISQFCLGTSLNGIDALDDICIRYQAENEEYIIFLQAKHRKDVNKGRVTYQELWKNSGDFSLPKYFRSYLKIRERFVKINDDVIYEGKYEDVKCIFIIYTPGTHDLQINNIKKTTLRPTISDLIWSGKCYDKFQYKYTEKDVNLLKQIILVEDMKCLGRCIFELKDKYNNMMSNDYIRKFHVVLAQKVFNVSDVTTKGFRWGTFRDEFFLSNDELLMTIKETIFREAVRKTNVSKVILKNLIQTISKKLTVDNLSKVLQNINIHFDLKNNNLNILDDTFKNFNDNLSSIKVSLTVFNDALEIATKEKLHLLHFKLPITFGNTDIAVKNDKRLEYLAQQIKNIISNTDGKIIYLNKNCIGQDKLIETGVVKKGGLGTAIGNLLILDQTTKMLKFNMSYESLGPNSQKLLKKIQSIPALETYRLQIDINDFPKLTFDEECNEIITKDFLNNLWFFTSQAKEDETEKYSKGVLYEYHNANRRKNKKVSSIRCDAIFFKIHDAVQKWWLKDGESHYLTNKSQDISKILSDFDGTSILSILNYICITKMDNYNIEFNEDTINCLHLHGDLIVIETEVNFLTGIKLMQYFRETISKFSNCTFLNLDYVLSISETDYDSFIDEIKNTRLETLVIICGNKAETNNFEENIINRLVSESIVKKIIIVTDVDNAVNVEQNAIDKQFEKIVDNRINLIDITPDSQRVVLEKYLIFQGMQVKWNKIINEESKKFIKPKILNRILKGDKVEISKSLTNSKYEEMKDYYVTRTLRCPNTTIPINKVDLNSHTSLVLSPYSSNEGDEVIVIKTLQDLDDIVVLLAAPGMGKSTILTHFSLATKEDSPGLWIERIDLINYGCYFNYLKENKIKINEIEAIKFICKIILSKKIQSRHNMEASINEIKFDIELQNGELILVNFEDANIIALLTLELFIECFNKRNTIFLFDGFDEVCPRYKAEITLLLKCLMFLPANDASENSCVNQKMWITSRSYNNIRRTLEAEFGASYILEPFTDFEQELIMENYLKSNLKLRELNYQQFENIGGLFEYVKSFTGRMIGERKSFKLTDLLLRGVYFSAVKYFQSEIKHTPLSSDKKEFVSKWNLLNLFRATITEAFPIRNKKINEVLYCNRYMQNFIQTPLHMYIAIEYLKNKVIDTSIKYNSRIEKWNLDINTFDFYERFFEEKIRTILFKEKGQVDLNNTDLYRIFEKERKEFIDNHKKIAFYSIFNDDNDEILPEEVAIKIKDVIDKMESGEEKTGIVDYVINGVPKFIHLCFAEYLAVEYISDLIKTTQPLQQIKLWNFILHKLLFKGIRGVLSVLDLKLCNDSDLRNAILNLNVVVKEFIFNELLEQTLDPSDEYALTVLDDVVVNSLRYIARMLLTVVTDTVNEHNYDKFEKFLQKTTYFFYASVDLGFTELMDIVFDCARKSGLESNMSSFESKTNNAEIMNYMKKMINDNNPNDNLHQETAQLAYIY